MAPVKRTALLIVGIGLAVVSGMYVQQRRGARHPQDDTNAPSVDIAPFGAGLGFRDYPTDATPREDARQTAEAVAERDPELGGPSIIPTLTTMLQAEDPYIRFMAASAAGRIAMSGDAYDSGLRATLRRDTVFLEALNDTVGYVYYDGFSDSSAREQSASALLWLFVDEPTAAVEAVIVDQYWLETDDEVRRTLVAVLGEHGYSSGATRDVLLDAAQAYDDRVAELAQDYLDEMSR